MHVAVLGAGALGSVFGGYLAQAGVTVTLVGRPAHMEAIRRNGLRITGVRGEHVVRENLSLVSDPGEVTGHVDYLMLAVKGRDTGTVLAEADGLRERTGAALSLQNSVTKDERLAEWIGAERVIGAATIEGASLIEPGVVLNGVTVPATMYVGELDGERSTRVLALAEALDGCGLGTQIADDVRQVQWEKLAQICVASCWALTTLPALPELGMGEGFSRREGAEHFVTLAREAVAVYRTLGYEPQDFFAPLSRLRTLAGGSLDEGVELISSLAHSAAVNRATRTSMHEDLLARRPTEVDDIVKPFVDRSRDSGVAAPTVLAAYRIIKTLDHFLVRPEAVSSEV